MKPIAFAFLLLFSGIAGTALAQHDSTMHHGHDPKPATDNHAMHDNMKHKSSPMSHAFSTSLPMNRNGSGTGWLPDQSPMYAWMSHGEKWMFMTHGAIFIRQNFQNINNSYRNGGRQFDAPTWIMSMAQRRTGRNGLLMFRVMMSPDPFTVGNSGYPLLFQSGESYRGQPLVNRQHPHDLFSELAAGYTQKLSDDLDVSLYVGYPGEPSVGPTAFMHRISSMNNPDAPLGHHWQDATHITFGVATIGIRYKQLKLEASSFTGREPDERRYGFDKPRFDSYSYRLSYAPSSRLVLQASRALLIGPEPAEPNEDVERTTASLIYSDRMDGETHLTAAAVWGLNQGTGHHSEHSVLAEVNYQMKKSAFYTRYEFIQKSPDELRLALSDVEVIPIHSTTLGYNYQLGNWFRTSTAVGAQATLSLIPAYLEASYGKSPVSLEVYLRVTPKIMASVM